MPLPLPEVPVVPETLPLISDDNNQQEDVEFIVIDDEDDEPKNECTE